MRRLLAAAGLVAAFVYLFAPAANAQQDVDNDDAIAELDRVRDALAETLDLFDTGQTEDALASARAGYLDHFELVEIPLRVLDPGFTLDTEDQFAQLRQLLDSGAPASDVRAQVAELLSAMDNAERILSNAGVLAPSVSFTQSFVIIFREGLEAVLLLSIVLGYLETTRRGDLRRPVLTGVGFAVAASFATFLLASVIFSIAPIGRELLEAFTALLAVAVLFYVSFWLVARLEQRRWLEFVRSKTWAAVSSGSSLALVAVGFTAVYREGFETALMYQALAGFGDRLLPWILAGFGAGVVALAAVSFAIFRLGRRLPVRAMLGTCVVLVMALSIGLLGTAIHELQNALLIPTTPLTGWPRLPILVAQTVGWYPTVQTVLAQGILVAVYVAGAIWFFVIHGRDRAISGSGPDTPLEAAEPVDTRTA